MAVVGAKLACDGCDAVCQEVRVIVHREQALLLQVSLSSRSAASP
jgi:hypothetical protein